VNRALFALLASFVAASPSMAAPTVTFVSPCECQGFHGKNRWVTKTDLSPVPLDKSAIQSVTPSQIYEWEGPGPNVELTRYTEERMPSEQPEVATVKVDLPKKLVTITTKPGKTLSDAKVKEVVTYSGYAMRKIVRKK
jgi:copper chaperone CopZ